jgi:hypothetical protein
MSRATVRHCDAAWFAACITASSHGSLRGIASRMTSRRGSPLNASALWRMLRGERTMTITEARQLADLLEQPLDEVIRRAGIDMQTDGSDVEARLRQAQRAIRALLGHIDEHGVRLPASVRAAAQKATA